MLEIASVERSDGIGARAIKQQAAQTLDIMVLAGRFAQLFAARALATRINLLHHKGLTQSRPPNAGARVQPPVRSDRRKVTSRVSSGLQADAITGKIS